MKIPSFKSIAKLSIFGLLDISMWSGKCLIVDLMGGKKPWFGIFAHFHEEIFSMWLFSSSQCGVTEHGIDWEEMLATQQSSTH